MTDYKLGLGFQLDTLDRQPILQVPVKKDLFCAGECKTILLELIKVGKCIKLYCIIKFLFVLRVHSGNDIMLTINCLQSLADVNFCKTSK